MKDRIFHYWVGLLSLFIATVAVPAAPPVAHGPTVVPQSISVQQGRDIWFNNTYGGEKFFAALAQAPDPQQRLEVGLRNIVETPRRQRFQTWGTLNDPDCRANPNGGADLCPDPHATGVIGIRRFAGADGETLYGVSCASCHAGLHPLNPPQDLNEPDWDNIHPTIGNQYLQAGKIFAVNLAPDDPRRLLFGGWPDGTVDTSLLFTDHIMNPGVITAFWEQRHRPEFMVQSGAREIRSGQGGEDDLGGGVAALRVYTNIGVCYRECIAPRPDRPDPLAPIDLAQCRRDCADLPPAQDIADLVRFLRAVRAPRYPGQRQGRLYGQGRRVFAKHCGDCHAVTGPARQALSNDEINPLIMDPVNATHACRALTTNWEAGHIWAPFSSDNYKARAAAQLKGYRTMPLTGIWATAPLLHNVSIGPLPAPTATPDERVEAFRRAMLELMSRERTPKVYRLPVDLGPFPAGTPLTQVFSRDPATGELLCADAVENKGHYYGADLPEADKQALIHWLIFQ